MSFEKKSIIVEIQEKEGLWKVGDGFYIFDKTPVEVKINRTAPNYSAKIRIYNIEQSALDEISKLKLYYIDTTRRGVRVKVRENGVETIIFTGNIVSATPVYSATPEVYLDIEAYAGIYFNFDVIPPTSFQGSISAPDLIREQICQPLGLGLESFFRDGKVPIASDGAVFNAKGLTNRLREIATAYNFDFIIKNEKVYLYEKGMPNGRVFWEIDQKAYIGYPSFTPTGIRLTLDTVVDIDLKDVVEVKKSVIKQANDFWIISKVNFDLSTRIGGNWQETIEGFRDIERINVG